MLPPAGRQTRAIPLNAASNGRELSEICSILGGSETEHPQLAKRINRIDRDFLFGNTWPPCSRVGSLPSPRNWGPLRYVRAQPLYILTILLYI